MSGLLHLAQQHPYWAAIVGYWIFSNAVDSLPAPNGSSGKLYRWFYQFSHGLAGNVFSAFASKIPGVKPG